MVEEKEEELDFEQFLEEYEGQTSNSLVDGIIVEISGDSVLVDVKQKSEGKLHISEITNADGELIFKVGDTIPVLITALNGERPAISYKKVIQKKLFNEFVSNNSSLDDLVVEGKIKGLNKKGFIVQDESGLEYFMPFSHSYLKKDNAIGKKIKAKVLKTDENKNSIIISRKKYLDEIRAKKDAKIKEILDKKDEILTGVVKSITSYGMFVDLGGIDGLVNYNEISYKGPVNPAEYFEEGEEVEVKLIDFDDKKQHLSLSIKAAYPDPWEEIKDELEVGDVISVIVSNFESYGAFVDLGNDIEGLLHISEISWDKNIKKPEDVLELGQEINVEVIEIDPDKKRLRVSLKSLQEKPFDKFIKEHKVGDVLTGKVVTIAPFGAFVNLGEIDGLLHNEEVSWDKVKCKDVLNKGDEVEVKIIKIEKDKENISLSRKVLLDSPAKEFQNEHPVGSIVKAKVKDKKDFGIFIALKDNLDGLIRNEDLYPLKADEINIGDEIEAVVVNIDVKKNKVRLSVKSLQRQKEREKLEKINSNNASTTLGDLIKDKIKK